MIDLLMVAFGGAIGTLGRRHVGAFVHTRANERLGLVEEFPFGTLPVNLLGALALGAVIRAAERSGGRLAWMRDLLGVGFCGAFSTFSALSLEYVRFAVEEEHLAGVLYVLGSLVVGGVLAWIGARLVDLASPPGRRKDAAS